MTKTMVNDNSKQQQQTSRDRHQVNLMQYGNQQWFVMYAQY